MMRRSSPVTIEFTVTYENKQKRNTSDLYTLKLKLLGQINVVRCNRIIYNLLICSIYTPLS